MNLKPHVVQGPDHLHVPLQSRPRDLNAPNRDNAKLQCLLHNDCIIHGILFTASITITEEVRVQYESRTVANYSIFRLLELSLV